MDATSSLPRLFEMSFQACQFSGLKRWCRRMCFQTLRLQPSYERGWPLGARTLLGTSATLVVTGALLVVTRTLLGAKGITTSKERY